MEGIRRTMKPRIRDFRHDFCDFIQPNSVTMLKYLALLTGTTLPNRGQNDRGNGFSNGPLCHPQVRPSSHFGSRHQPILRHSCLDGVAVRPGLLNGGFQSFERFVR